jgi:hypothetical protein
VVGRPIEAQGYGELKTPHPCRMEAGAGSDHDGTRNIRKLYVPGRPFATVQYIYSGINQGEEFKSCFFSVHKIQMKTVSGSLAVWMGEERPPYLAPPLKELD